MFSATSSGVPKQTFLYLVNAVFHKLQTNYSVTTVQQIQAEFHVPKDKLFLLIYNDMS